MACSYYVIGVLHALDAGIAQPASGYSYCWRTLESKTIGQIVAVVVDYLKANSVDLHWSPPYLITLAVSSAWPCGEQA